MWSDASLNENFQPIPVSSPQDSPLFFRFRCIVDLQLFTIYRFLYSRLRCVSGNILDIGAGQAPWKSLLPLAVDYVGVDVYSKDDFGMESRSDVILYDGITLPFGAAEFDNAMCIEVLEHVPEPEAFLSELSRILKPGAPLFLTVPWAARIHYVPHDYHRFTRFRLKSLLEDNGFNVEYIMERGNDIATVSNKLIVIQVGLLNSKNSLLGLLWRWPLALFLAPVVCGFLVAAHLCIYAHRGSMTDPLGYSIVARKRSKNV
jgi:SAM-dependent methyltransferase